MVNQTTNSLTPTGYVGSTFSYAPVYILPKAPASENYKDIPIGTLWINTTDNSVSMLVAKVYNPGVLSVQGTWTQFIGNTITEVHTDAGTAIPLAGVLSIFGGLNVNTNAVANAVFINLDDNVHIIGSMSADDGFVTTAGNINLPNTNAGGTEGVIQFDVNPFISNYGNENTFVGANSGNTTSTGGGLNAGFGTNALKSLTNGSGNCCIGWRCGEFLTNCLSNTALGSAALNLANISANANTALGHFALSNLLTGHDNISIGSSSGNSYVGAESSNIVIGHVGSTGENHVIRLGTDGTAAGEQDTCYIAGTTNIARNLNLNSTTSTGTVGAIYTGGGTARFITNPGTFNVFVGEASGPTYPFVGLAQGNTGIGANVMTAITGASGNTSVGFGAGNAMVNNIDNVCLGHNAGNVLAAGNLNVFVGAFAGQFLTGNVGTIGNTALGYAALNNCTGGSANLCLGGFSGQSLTTNESNNVLIQNNGVVGRSREIRIGTTYTGGAGDGQQSKCWIAAIRGVTTDVADAIPVLIDSTGQLGTVSSSARYKDDIDDMGAESDMIHALRPVTFVYKSDQSKTKQYGLLAEEVDEVFPSLVVYDKEGLPDAVKYHDLPVLLLNELQKCMVIIENLQERIAKLEVNSSH